MLPQCLELRSEQKRAADLRVVERLFPEAVAREDEAPLGLVPEREREHAVQPLDAVRAEVFVEMHEHLGVSVRRETVAACLEFAAQLAEVVDLAVEDELDGAVLVRDRLVARLEVDDRKAAEAEAGRDPLLGLQDIETFVVRTAMPKGPRHPREHLPIDGFGPHDPADPAHGSLAAT